MIKKGTKIVFLLAYFLSAFSAYGISFVESAQNLIDSESTIHDDLNFYSKYCISSRHDKTNGSAIPFSNGLGIELEPDEEDLNEKDFITSFIVTYKASVCPSLAISKLNYYGTYLPDPREKLYNLFEVYLI